RRLIVASSHGLPRGVAAANLRCCRMCPNTINLALYGRAASDSLRTDTRLLWGISGHLRRTKPCPLYPRKRTLSEHSESTAKGIVTSPVPHAGSARTNHQ